METRTLDPAIRARQSRDRLKLLFEEGRVGRRGLDLPPLDVPDAPSAIDPELTRDSVEGIPELS